jgi:hypothetical protein
MTAPAERLDLAICSAGLSVREAYLATHASDNGALVPAEPVGKGQEDQKPRLSPGRHPLLSARQTTKELIVRENSPMIDVGSETMPLTSGGNYTGKVAFVTERRTALDVRQRWLSRARARV